MNHKKTTTPVALTTSEAIVLQQLHEEGEDDARSLARMLGMSRHHTMAVVRTLRRKGLVMIDNNDELWIRLTSQGKQLMNYLWPEARGFSAA